MKSPPPSRTADQFVVRLPDGMRDQIATAAKTNNRSMNAEIVDRLSRSLDEQPADSRGPVELGAKSVKKIADAVSEAMAKRVTRAAPLPRDLSKKPTHARKSSTK